jgi:hypothetical protein
LVRKVAACGLLRLCSPIEMLVLPTAAVNRPKNNLLKQPTACSMHAYHTGSSGRPQMTIDSVQWVRVECDGVQWGVAPEYIYGVGIGEAQQLAQKNNCVLPTPKLVDAIYKAADLKLEPLPRKPGPDMGTAEVLALQEARIRKQIAGRAFKLLGGTHKDVICTKGGQIGIYGWHELNGKVIQGVFFGHSLQYKDYSQGLRFCQQAG